MSTLTQLKLGLAVAGLILFGYGVRAEANSLRWTGIGFLAAAAILRFVGPRSTRHPRREDDVPPDAR